MTVLEDRFVTKISIIVIVAFLLYAGAWIFAAFALKAKTEWVVDHAAQTGITLSLHDMRLSGFPHRPSLHLNGTASFSNGISMTTPDFTVRGFPFIGLKLELSLPQGAHITTPLWPQLITINNARIVTEVPPFAFETVTKDTLRLWQQTGHSIPIHDVVLQSNLFTAAGKGFIGLDHDLQPQGQVMLNILGLGTFIEQMVTAQKIDARQAIMAQSLLQLVSHKDPSTGEEIVATSLRIQKNAAYLGPLRFYTFAPIEWGR
jgi:hypothetical protein